MQRRPAGEKKETSPTTYTTEKGVNLDIIRGSIAGGGKGRDKVRSKEGQN